MPRHHRPRSSSLSKLDQRIRMEREIAYGTIDNNNNNNNNDNNNEYILERPSLLYDKMRIRYGDIGRISTYSEVFFDLTYVLVLQQLFIATVIDDIQGIAKFIGVWCVVWNSWNGLTFFTTRFDTDDTIARIHIVLTMIGVLGLSIGIHNDNMKGFIASYCVIRFLLILAYIRAYISIINVRLVTGLFICGFGFATLCWFIGIMSYNTNIIVTYIFWSIGLFLCYGTPFFMLPIMVPYHGDHMQERNGCFTVLISAGVIFNYNIHEQYTIRKVICDVIGLGIPYALNLLYSSVDGPNMQDFMISNINKLKSYLWIYLHMPLLLFITLSAISMGYIDCVDNIHHTMAARCLLVSLTCVHFILFCLHLLSRNATIGTSKFKRAKVRLFFMLLFIILSIIMPKYGENDFQTLIITTILLSLECLFDVSPFSIDIEQLTIN